MPVFTPSRVAMMVLTLSLLSFLWSFGLPQQFATPSLPIINHDVPGQQIEQPFEKPLGDGRPYLPPDNPRNKNKPQKASETPKPNPTPDKPKPKPTSTPTPKPKPVESKISEVTGDKKEEDKEKDKEKEGKDKEMQLAKSSAKPSPATATSAPVLLSTATILNNPVKTSAPTSVPPIKFCKDVHGAPNVVVIVRTSKAEIGDKLPAHLKTLVSCVPNFVIFSDHAGTIDGLTVHDALDTISNATKASHNEFVEYEKIRQDKNYNPDKEKTKQLDKWKFLPMVYKAHTMHPSARFYIFIEADTSLSWTNLLQWIDRLDYRIPYYSGAPTFINDIRFAQRGSGILLSWGAMKQYAKMYYERYSSEWEKRVGRECCGDMVLATTLLESNVEFYSSFPLLQGEKPSTLDWSDRHWCAPTVTWHHISPLEMESLWFAHENWTTRNGWERPYLFRDAFNEFVMPRLEEMKEGWDNLSQDTRIKGPNKEKEKEKAEKERLEKEKQEQEKKEQEKKEQQAKAQDSKDKSTSKRTDTARDDTADANKPNSDIDNAAESAKTCKHLCEVTDDCIQWKFTNEGDHECSLGKVIRLGHESGLESSEKGSTSGWVMDKVKKAMEEWGGCENVKWKFNQ